jgi:Glycosyl hydrolase family 115
MAWARGAHRIWIVNVGDLKPLELPISYFFDLAYDAPRWGVDSTQDWLSAWVTREFGSNYTTNITSVMTRYGMFAARRKFELIEPETYSVLNYNEADAILEQWGILADDAQAVYDALSADYQPAFFEMILHPILGGQIVHKIYIAAARNQLWASQRRNAANDLIDQSIALLDADANLTVRWNQVLNGKWNHMMDRKQAFAALDEVSS